MITPTRAGPVHLAEGRRRRLSQALPHLEIGAVIGSGAGGSVLAARVRSSGELVAVKVLADERRTQPGAIGRMAAEAEVLMACSHPNLVAGLEWHPGGALGDMDVLVMEHVAAPTVLRHSWRSGLDEPTAVAVVVAAAKALDHLHGRGYLHLDVKPENILLVTGGEHRLIDFGLARRWPAPPTGEVWGTAWYMAPEMALGRELTPATDVYALAMTAYELLAGHLPFPPVADHAAVLRQQVELAPAPLATVAPGVACVVAEAVMAGLAKAPPDRPTAVEIAAALVDATSGLR